MGIDRLDQLLESRWTDKSLGCFAMEAGGKVVRKSEFNNTIIHIHTYNYIYTYIQLYIYILAFLLSYVLNLYPLLKKKKRKKRGEGVGLVNNFPPQIIQG